MEFDTTSSTMYQKNGSIQHQVSNSTIFDKNLHRINENLKYVNQYYTPKYKLPVANRSTVIVSEQSNKPVAKKIDPSTDIYSELYKIVKNEIESQRKTDLCEILNNKINTWALKKREHSIISSKIDEKKSMSLVSKRLAIDRNYKELLQDGNNNPHQSELLKYQIIFDQKKRNIQFNMALKNANSLLNDIKQLLSENQKTQSFSNQMKICMRFEADIKEFNNMLQNSNENDLFAVNKLIQQIQIFNEQFMKTVSINPQIENFPFSTDDENDKKNISFENFTFKINENNTPKINEKFEDVNSEIVNFTFKIDENPEVKSDNSITFSFKINEEAANSNTPYSSVNVEESKNFFCNFEDDYKQYSENYLSIQKYLKEITETYSSFLHQEDLKTLRQELTKSINTPINSISSVSSWHMKDKFDRINALLKCRTVITGNSTVSVNAHPDALIFCKSTLAKKIIKIGEQVTSVKTETAFEVASIVAELWQIYPDFGILLYARFKQKCPCLIPYNAAKTNKETYKHYYKSLGYNYTNGVVERHNDYVKRMTGIIRLFAAIIVTETRSGKALGIGQAWMLIAITVNLVPQLDVTAILLHEMLVITGHDLNQAYGRQFIKMLRYVDSKYMRKIDVITPIGCGSPVQRLKTFISNAIREGFIEKPKGIIPPKFW